MTFYLDTKHILAITMIELMKTTPMSKITVKSITGECGARRQTFYYHFKDKYDLVTWIYKTEADEIVDQMTDATWQEIATEILKKMQTKRQFYKNAFSEEGQNSLIEYLVKYDTELYTRILKTRSNVKELHELLLFSIECHSIACVNMTKKWIDFGMEDSPEWLAEKLITAMPENLKTNLP